MEVSVDGRAFPWLEASKASAPCDNMGKVIGFACFCIALGMLIMWLLPNDFAGCLIGLILLFVGYQLFCCENRKK